MRWRLAITGAHDGAYNMAFDEWLLEQLLRGRSGPVLRLYRFLRPTITMGYAQDYEREIDVGRCAEVGISVVRRPTGGRAVFHADDLTYSVVARRDDPWAGGSTQATYRAIAGAVGRGLAHLGVETELARAGHSLRGSSRLCFASSARYELLAAGKKIVGSAQLRRGGGVLQQGSLSLAGDGTEGVRFVAVRSTPGALEDLRDRVTTVGQVLGRRVRFDEATEALTQGFEEALGYPLAEMVLDPMGDPLFARLETKYRSPDWNERRRSA
jgi:lipoate-protein ligase A